MILEIGIDLDCPLLLGFLLDDRECGIVQKHCPSQSFRITNTKSEECTTSNIQTHRVILVPVEFADKRQHGVPGQIITSGMMCRNRVHVNLFLLVQIYKLSMTLENIL